MNTTKITSSVTKLLLALLLFAVSTGQLKAQDIEGGDFQLGTIGSVKKAEKLYRDMAYHDAIPLYEAYLKKHDSTRLMAQLGDCYRLTSKFDKAEYWYGKATDKGDADPKYKLFYAQMLQVNGKYDDAAKWYAQYKNDVPEDRRSTNEMKVCTDDGPR